MRRFSYFLYQNFDPDIHSENPLNPRHFQNAGTDAILSYIAGFPAGACNYEKCAGVFGNGILNTLIAGGIIKRKKDYVLFDTPVFLCEDAKVLRSRMGTIANKLTDTLETCIPQIHDLCSAICNGFSIELNMYHVLCGMVFDGYFFDYLEQCNAVSTSRMHASGLDYLSIIYEQCPELDAYSDGLLCSYNRFANSHCALQSFGDANGDRHDFYRFFRMIESGELPERYQTAKQLLDRCGCMGKDEILHHVSQYVQHGSGSAPVMALLEHFGYAKDGAISVPIYTAEDDKTIKAIASTVEAHLGEHFAAELTALSKEVHITANSHGVSSGEIANEIYHILFGSINEELVRRGIVAQPPYISGEGRYYCSIQLQ
ncbi:MAG: hypothetical protein IKV90_05780 [Clostridia bacterium]|nr:hypothetical protein [Clostridia bacterium]